MPQLIEVPGHGVVEFPDGMTDDQIAGAIKANLQPSEFSPAEQQKMRERHWVGLSRDQFDKRVALERKQPGEYDAASFQYQQKNAQPGVMSAVGGAALRSPVTLADATMSVGRNMAAAPLSGLAGILATPANLLPGVDNAGNRTVNAVQNFIGGQPLTEGGRQVVDAAAYIPGKIEQGTDWVGEKAAKVTGSPLVGATVKTAINAAPMLATRLLGRGKVRDDGNADPTAPRGAVEAGKVEASASVPAQAGRGGGLERVPQKAPALEELQAQKNAAYKRAEESGVVVSAGAMNRLKVDLFKDLQDEGLNKTLHPKANAALYQILETGGDLKLTKIETLRKIANDARMSPDPADARLGARIIERIDDFEEGLAPADLVGGEAASATAFKEARALNQRYAKARTIQEIFDDAEVAAGANYTSAGLETALRQKFRALATNRKKLRGFTPQEVAAIRQVATGGKLQNALRLLGKAAPTGIVSAGMGTTLGFMFGGPAGSAVVPGIGAASKFAATRMGLRKANRVSEMVRAGPEASTPKPTRQRLKELYLAD
jgi:hypothetical protein